MKDIKSHNNNNNELLERVKKLEAKLNNTAEENTVTNDDMDDIEEYSLSGAAVLLYNKTANTIKVKVTDEYLSFITNKFEKIASFNTEGRNVADMDSYVISESSNNADVFEFNFVDAGFGKKAEDGQLQIKRNGEVYGVYKASYNQYYNLTKKFIFCNLESFGWKQDRITGEWHKQSFKNRKKAEIVMQNIFFDNPDELKEYQESQKKQNDPNQNTDNNNIPEDTNTDSEIPSGDEGKSMSDIDQDVNDSPMPIGDGDSNIDNSDSKSLPEQREEKAKESAKSGGELAKKADEEDVKVIRNSDLAEYNRLKADGYKVDWVGEGRIQLSKSNGAEKKSEEIVAKDTPSYNADELTKEWFPKIDSFKNVPYLKDIKSEGELKEFIQNQIAMGREVEKEHTDDDKKAEKISSQHVREVVDYYIRLKKLEDDAKKELGISQETKSVVVDNPNHPLKETASKKIKAWTKSKKAEFVNKYALEEWKYEKDYAGEDYSDYYIAGFRSRDSDNIENSNFDEILKRLGGENEDAGVIVARFNHWAVGWIEEILVKKDATDKVDIAKQIEKDIDIYTVLDEDDYSRREMEDYDQWFDENVEEYVRDHYDFVDMDTISEEDKNKLYDLIREYSRYEEVGSIATSDEDVRKQWTHYESEKKLGPTPNLPGVNAKKTYKNKIATSIQKGDAYVKRFVDKDVYEYDKSFESILKSNISDDEKYIRLVDRVKEIVQDMPDEVDTQIVSVDWDDIDVEPTDIQKIIDRYNEDKEVKEKTSSKLRSREISLTGLKSILEKAMGEQFVYNGETVEIDKQFIDGITKKDIKKIELVRGVSDIEPDGYVITIEDEQGNKATLNYPLDKDVEANKGKKKFEHENDFDNSNDFNYDGKMQASKNDKGYGKRYSKEGWEEKLSLLKRNYFKQLGSNGNWTAPHGQNYSESYLQGLSSKEFEDMIKKENPEGFKTSSKTAAASKKCHYCGENKWEEPQTYANSVRVWEQCSNCGMLRQTDKLRKQEGNQEESHGDETKQNPNIRFLAKKKSKIDEKIKRASVQKYALHEWKYPKYYMGTDWSDYYVVLGRSRDSDNLENSNFEAALKMLGGEQEPEVVVARSNHWAVGWVEELLVKKDANDKVEIAKQIEGKIGEYPVLDEDDYSRREMEDYDAWFNENVDEYIKDYYYFVDMEELSDGDKEKLYEFMRQNSRYEEVGTFAIDDEEVRKQWSHYVSEQKANGTPNLPGVDASKKKDSTVDKEAVGYADDYSKSNNAYQAEREGKFPASIAAKKLGVSVDAIKQFLTPSEWHHTSKYYNTTDYYDISEFLDGNIDDEHKELLKKMKEFRNEKSEEKKYKANVKYLTWSGTRNHPKATEHKYENIDVIEKGQFYTFVLPDGSEVKKKVDSKGTSVKKVSHMLEAAFKNQTLQTENLHEGLVAAIRKIQEGIDKDILDEKEDEPKWLDKGKQLLLHTTILFGIEQEEKDKIQEIVKKYTDKGIKVSNKEQIEYFDNDNTCAYVPIIGEELTKLHDELKSNVKNKDEHPKYVGHIAIAYLKKGERLKDNKIEKFEWTISEIEMTQKDGRPYKISKKKIATLTVPENWDVDKDNTTKDYEVWSGGNDWEMNNVYIAIIRSLGNDKSRYWIKVNYEQFPNGSNGDDSKEEFKQKKEWGEKAKKLFVSKIKESIKNASINEEMFNEIVNSNDMKPYVEDYGIDAMEWIDKDNKDGGDITKEEWIPIGEIMQNDGGPFNKDKMRYRQVNDSMR